jgi:thioredoxin 1
MNELNENDFDTKVGSGLALVDFGAEWCGPCKALVPTLTRISSAYEGRMSVYSVDIDSSPSLAARNGVMSVPTLILFKDGKAVDRVVGLISEGDLRTKIEGQIGS